MNTFGEEVERIKNELADLGCYMAFGMSCFDLAQKIYADVAQSAEALDLGSRQCEFESHRQYQ